MRFLLFLLLVAFSSATPAKHSLGTLLSKDKSFSLFAKLLHEANLMNGLDNASSLTIFAPPNAALQQTAADIAVSSGYLLPRTEKEAYDVLCKFFSADERKYILMTHLSPGSRSFNDVVAQFKFKTASGDALFRQGIRMVPSKLGEGVLKDVPSAELIVGPTRGMAAMNGMVHMIDRAILPFVPPKPPKTKM